MISAGPHLLAEGTGNEPPDAVGLSASCFHDLGQRRAALPFQQSHNGDGLAALAGATHGLDLFGAVCGFGCLLGRGGS